MIDKLKNLVFANALYCAVLAIVSIEISYILGGVRWLDAAVYLLIPAIVFFIAYLFLRMPQEVNDYRVSLVLMFVLLGISIAYKYNVVIGYHDDNYHIFKMIAHAVNNNFFSMWHVPFEYHSDTRFYFIDIVESLWGLLWRGLKWDFIVFMTQALPLLVIFYELMNFFRRFGVRHVAGCLSLVVLMSAQIFWSQQGSGFLDGIVGTFTLLTLLGLYNILVYPQQVTFYRLLGLALVSGLCINSKFTMIPVGFLGLGACLWSLERGNFRPWQRMWVITVSLLGVGYLFYFHLCTVIKVENPFFTYSLGWYSNACKDIFYAFPCFDWVRNLGINFPFAYLLASWLFDYEFRGWVTVDPFFYGRGFLWTFFVFPGLVVLGVIFLLNWKRLASQFFHPKALIFLLIACYYLFFRGSVSTRYMLGIDSFVMTWVLAVVWRKFEISQSRIAYFSKYLLCFIFMILAFTNFRKAADGDMYLRKKWSFVHEQFDSFPNYIH